jgi:hypothetical protein
MRMYDNGEYISTPFIEITEADMKRVLKEKTDYERPNF